MKKINKSTRILVTALLLLGVSWSGLYLVIDHPFYFSREMTNEELYPHFFCGRFGYITKDSLIAIPFDYYWASPFFDDCALVLSKSTRNGAKEWNIINKKGEKRTTLDIDTINNYPSGKNYPEIIVIKNGKYGLFDICHENYILPPNYESLSHIRGNYYSIKRNLKYSLYNNNNKCFIYEDEVNPSDYRVGGRFLNGKWKNHDVYINDSGQFALPVYIANAYNIQENRKAICCNRKWGFINRKNDVVIPFEFDDAGVFHNGLCRVNKEGLWGLIDTIGNMVVDIKYKNVSIYADYYVDGNKKFFIDNMGKIIRTETIN